MCPSVKIWRPTRPSSEAVHDALSADAAAVRPYPFPHSFWPRSGPVFGFPVRASMRAAIGARRHAAAGLSASPRPPRESKRPGNSAGREGAGPREPNFPQGPGRQRMRIVDFGVSTRKSLIVETSAAMCCPPFATSRAVFATSPIFAPAALAPFSLLSNSLKKKKKEYVEGHKFSRKAMPLVRRVLPRVADAAYFLGHELEGGATCNSWQPMARTTITNQRLACIFCENHESTSCSACPSLSR